MNATIDEFEDLIRNFNGDKFIKLQLRIDFAIFLAEKDEVEYSKLIFRKLLEDFDDIWFLAKGVPAKSRKVLMMASRQG